MFRETVLEYFAGSGLLLSPVIEVYVKRDNGGVLSVPILLCGLTCGLRPFTGTLGAVGATENGRHAIISVRTLPTLTVPLFFKAALFIQIHLYF